MANRCVITKLKESVSDYTLSRLGETPLKLKATKANTLLIVCAEEDYTLRVLGKGTVIVAGETYTAPFSVTLAAGIYYEVRPQSGFDGTLMLPRYTARVCNYVGEVDIEGLQYSSTMTALNAKSSWELADGSDVLAPYGNTDNISRTYQGIIIDNSLTARILGDSVKGSDILRLLDSKAATPICYIIANGVGMNLKNMPQGRYAAEMTALKGQRLSGDLSSLSGCTFCKDVVIGHSLNVTGDIAHIHFDANLTTTNGKVSLGFKSCPNITGNLGAVDSRCTFFTTGMDFFDSNDDVTNALTPLPVRSQRPQFTWSSQSARPSSAYIMALEEVCFATAADLDNMLINQAACIVGFTEDDFSYRKTINVFGQRTSASDAAVATLVQKGYTVIINAA